MPKTKEDHAAYNRAYHRAYYQTTAGKKSLCIYRWKRQGIISDDWDALYERYQNTTHCEKCEVLLTDGLSRTGKCLDHDHSITDRENVRAVLCNACNSNDKCTNTSGVPNVSYNKRHAYWLYQKTVNGVIYTKNFKTKKEAIRYKYKYEHELDLESLLEVPDATP